MSTPADWMKTLQQTQSDLMQQWTALSAAWFPAAAGTGATASAATGAPGSASPGAAPGAPADPLRQFMAQFEQYAGLSRSLWDLAAKAAGQPNADQRVKSFNEGVVGLQQQLAGMWTGLMPAMPGAMPPMSGVATPPWPALGPNREQQELWQKLLQATTRVTQAQVAMGTQWIEIVSQSLRALGSRMGPSLQTGAVPGSMKELYDQWINTAEATYAQAAHGAAFVAAQGELTNALSQLRVVQRELFEQWARQFDLPTRAELNSMHQQLRELRAAVQRLGGV